MREKTVVQFKSHWQAQRFLYAHNQINLTDQSDCPPRRFQLTVTSYRPARIDAFSLWADYASEMVA